MDLPTYTNIWRIEKRLYKLYDFRLPMPLPVGQIAVFLAIAIPYVVVLSLIGLPFSHTLLWVYVLPPGVLAWLTTRPVLEGKRLPELVVSQLRYLLEPRTWCRLAPLAEKDEVIVLCRVWRRAEPVATADVAADTVAVAAAPGVAVAVAGTAAPAGMSPAAPRERRSARPLALAPRPARLAARPASPATRHGGHGGHGRLAPPSTASPVPAPVLPSEAMHRDVHAEQVRAEPVRAESGREQVRAEPVRAEPVREQVHAEPVRAEAVREQVHAEPVRGQAMGGQAIRGQARGAMAPAEPMRAEPGRAETVRPEPGRAEPMRAEPGRAEPMRAEPGRAEPMRAEPVRAETVRPEPTRTQMARGEPLPAEPAHPESARPGPVIPPPVYGHAQAGLAPPPEDRPQADSRPRDEPESGQGTGSRHAPDAGLADRDSADLESAARDGADQDNPARDGADQDNPALDSADRDSADRDNPDRDSAARDSAATVPPPRARPVVKVTGDLAAERPLRVVERALRSQPGRRPDGWHDRVVVVPGGHRPGKPDQLQRDRARARLPVAGPRRIVVLGCTRGAGQTTTALLAGDMLAHLRAQPVAVLDLNPGRGSLTDLASAIPGLMRETLDPAPASLAGPMAAPVPEDPRQHELGLQVISGTGAAASGTDAGRILDVVAARYPLTLADPAASCVPRALDVADHLIIVAPASAEAASALAMTFEWLEAHGHDRLAGTAVTVVNGVSAATTAHVEHAAAVASGRCRAIVKVPWDNHLKALSQKRARSAPKHSAASLSPALTQAYTALAGVLISGLAEPGELRSARA